MYQHLNAQVTFPLRITTILPYQLVRLLSIATVIKRVNT